MFRRAIELLLVFILFTSCEFFSPATTSSSNQLLVLDSVIDYTKVDVYPIFPDCENYAENDNQKKCFEETITQKLSELLNKNEIKVKERVDDTTLIDILIDNTGKAKLVQICPPNTISKQLPELDSILTNSIAELPTMKPAVKRGTFVNSQYRLVIIVKTL